MGGKYRKPRAKAGTMGKGRSKGGFLRNARVYPSGPMDFVTSRAEGKKSGWRVRVREFLCFFGATVFDPWSKPIVKTGSRAVKNAA